MDLVEFGSFYMRLSRELYLQWLVGMYKAHGRSDFFQPYFDRLAGGRELREAIEKGLDETAIRSSWKPGIDRFMKVRARYLLYPDFP